MTTLNTIIEEENTPDTNPLDVLTNPDREAEKRELYERALEKTQVEQESKTTPDTEWEKWVRTLSNSTNPRDTDLLIAKIAVLLTSRDTYWKEKVREEVEGMKKDRAKKKAENKKALKDLRTGRWG